MAYDILILAFGITAAAGALVAAYDISSRRVRYVGFPRPTREAWTTRTATVSELSDESEAAPTVVTKRLTTSAVVQALWDLHMPKPVENVFSFKSKTATGRQLLLLHTHERSRLPHPSSGSSSADIRRRLLSDKIECAGYAIVQREQRTLFEIFEEQAKLYEHHTRALDDLEQRVRELEESFSRERQIVGDRPTRTAPSKTVH